MHKYKKSARRSRGKKSGRRSRGKKSGRRSGRSSRSRSGRSSHGKKSGRRSGRTSRGKKSSRKYSGRSKKLYGGDMEKINLIIEKLNRYKLGGEILPLCEKIKNILNNQREIAYISINYNQIITYGQGMRSVDFGTLSDNLQDYLLELRRLLENKDNISYINIYRDHFTFEFRNNITIDISNIGTTSEFSFNTNNFYTATIFNVSNEDKDYIINYFSGAFEKGVEDP